ESTPENMLIQGNQLELTNAIMAYPEGPVDARNGLWSWWEDGARQAETVTTFLNYASAMLDAAQRHVTQTSPESSARISLWGFSQGGAAALVYALLGSKPLFKAASVCGFLPEIQSVSERKNKSSEILGIFGSNDEVVPSFLAEHALDEMKNHGHNVIARETSQGHQLTSENLKKIRDLFNS
ncbi:MAG: dienelactone hydrolase family protein, partial [Nitrospinota bacterium]|nr:dienelactone hydrolase family protein [Nitrospinota bacterium]